MKKAGDGRREVEIVELMLKFGKGEARRGMLFDECRRDALRRNGRCAYRRIRRGAPSLVGRRRTG
eukprot:14477464-Heterocapsa_arctica.AAC.1